MPRVKKAELVRKQALLLRKKTKRKVRGGGKSCRPPTPPPRNHSGDGADLVTSTLTGSDQVET